VNNNGHEIPRPDMKRAGIIATWQASLGAEVEFAEFLREPQSRGGASVCSRVGVRACKFYPAGA
jgi:hypothetical protein